MKGSTLINVPGELNAPTKEGIVASAESVYDYLEGMNQEDLNKKVKQDIKILNNFYNATVLSNQINLTIKDYDNNIVWSGKLSWNSGHIIVPATDIDGLEHVPSEDSGHPQYDFIFSRSVSLIYNNEGIHAEDTGDRKDWEVYFTSSSSDIEKWSILIVPEDMGIGNFTFSTEPGGSLITTSVEPISTSAEPTVTDPIIDPSTATIGPDTTTNHVLSIGSPNTGGETSNLESALNEYLEDN